MKLLNEGTFELKAREVPAFLDVYKWANSIPKEFVSKPKEQKPEEEVNIKKRKKNK